MFIESLNSGRFTLEDQHAQLRRIADAHRQAATRAESAADIELRAALPVEPGLVAGEEFVVRAEHTAEPRQPDNAAVRMARTRGVKQPDRMQLRQQLLVQRVTEYVWQNVTVLAAAAQEEQT